MKVLVCPLNWGLGHAARCIPIIAQQLAENHEVVIAADGFPMALLRQEFPSLRFIECPSYSISYSTGKSQIGAMLRSFPSIIGGVFHEHSWLKSLIKTEHFDRVISDNRFGMWSSRCESIYITHQLMVKMPKQLKFIEPIVWVLHSMFIARYNSCWIPDSANSPTLSGDLSHLYPLPRNAKFIGPLSRFNTLGKIFPNKEFEVVAVLSGVEPQRTMLEQELISRFKLELVPTLIVCGQPRSEKLSSKIENITLVSHLESDEIAAILLGAKHIITRSGYSTIMDLDALNCLYKAEFIPTPGQTEQKYLAELHKFNAEFAMQ